MKKKVLAAVLCASMTLAFTGCSSELSNEYVTVKDWEYDDDSTTKSCTGYYITYEIGDGFYVLTSLIEEDNSTKFEIEILYSGDSMIDLEQTLSLYKD